MVLISSENGATSVIAGNGNFNVENLTIQTQTAHRVITCPASSGMYDDWGIPTPYPEPCSNVLVDHVTINQLTPLAAFGGAHDGLGAIHTLGSDITVQNSSVTALGSAPNLMWSAHHVVLSNNSIYNGDSQFDGFVDADQSIYENNLHAATPGTSGGMVSVEGKSHYLYVASNTIQNSLGTFGEGFAPGDQPYTADWLGLASSMHKGSAAGSDPDTVTVSNAQWQANQFVGEVLYVVSGTGAFQRNFVVANTEDTLTLRNLWQLPIDSTSILDLVKDHSEGIFYENTFSNVSVAVELYTQSYGFVIDHNTMTDSGGAYCVAWNKTPLSSSYQVFNAPINICYFNDFTNNTIAGSLNDPSNPNANVIAQTAVLGVVLDPNSMDSPSPVLGEIPPTVGNEIRGNSLSSIDSGNGSGTAIIGGVYNNGQASYSCAATPMPNGGATDTLVEGNTINGAAVPIEFWNFFGNTLLWDNHFDQGLPEDYSFTSCDPSVIIQEPVSGSVISGTMVPVSGTVATNTVSQSFQLTLQLDGISLLSANESSFAATVDSTGLANGPHYMTAVVKNSLGLSSESHPVLVNVQNVEGTTEPLIALVNNFSPGPIRSNYSGWVGTEITVGSSPITVYSLGRIYIAGNREPHIVKLVQSGSGIDVPGGSVQILPIGVSGEISYVSLAIPIVLGANSSFDLVSQETSGGDQWYDAGIVYGSTAANITGPVYYDGQSYTVVSGLAGQSYVPVSLLCVNSSSMNAASSSQNALVGR